MLLPLFLFFSFHSFYPPPLFFFSLLIFVKSHISVFFFICFASFAVITTAESSAETSFFFLSPSLLFTVLCFHVETLCIFVAWVILVFFFIFLFVALIDSYP